MQVQKKGEPGKLIRLVVIAVIAILCGAAHGWARPRLASSPYLVARVRTARKQIRSGRVVEILLYLTNKGREAATVRMSGTWEYDYRILNLRTHRIVYQWSWDQGTPPDTRFTMNPGESRINHEFWSGRDNNGRPVPPGTYRIEANIYPQPLVSAKFTVQDRVENDETTAAPPDDPAADNPEPVESPAIVRRDPPALPVGSAIPTSPNLLSDLHADRSTAHPGDSVRLTYTVHNGSRRRQSVRFSSALQADFEARTAAGESPRRIWAASDAMAFAQVLTQITLESGESRTFTAVWKPGSDLAEGTYLLTAYLTPIKGGHTAAATATLRFQHRKSGGYRPSIVKENAAERQSGATAEVTAPAERRPDPVFSDPADDNLPTVTLSDLLRDGARYQGRRVLLFGTYRGRRGSGGRPLSRSDWLLTSEGQAVTVRGIAPRCPMGEEIAIVGTVHSTPDNGVYLVE